MRILIVKLSAVGDVVHALPVLNALRTQLPDAHLGWAVHPGAANLLEGHPQLDELIVLPRRLPQYGGLAGFRKIVGNLRGRNGAWDAAIDLQGLTKSGLVTRLSGAKKRIGFAGKASRELNGFFMNRRIQPLSTAVIQMNMELLSALDLVSDGPAEAVLHTTADDDARVDDWARTAGVAGVRFVVLDAFAGWPSKLWPDESWIGTAGLLHQQHGLRPLLFHGPGERAHAEALAARMPATVGPVVAPDTTLRQYVSLLRKHAKLVIAADTGPMHMAAALGIPTIALFGPSDSRRNAPTFSNARYRALQDFTQPCAGTFTRLCKFHKPAECMATLRPDHVAEAVQQLFGMG